MYRVPSVQGPKTTKLGFKSIKLGAIILIKLVLGLSWGALGGENSHKIGPEGLFFGSWGHLGPKSRQDLQKVGSTPLRPPLLGPNMEAKIDQNRSKSAQDGHIWWSEGHLTQQEAEDGQSSPKMPQHSPQVHDFRAMLAGLSVPKHCKNKGFLSFLDIELYCKKLSNNSHLEPILAPFWL